MWLKASGSVLGDVVPDLIQTVADRELGRNLRDWKSSRLGSQRGAARNTWIHLDNDHATVFRVDRELDIRSASIHTDFPETAQGSVAHHLVLAIAQCLGRSYGDGVTGVHPHRVEVLDGANDDGVVRQVAHDFHFVLFPPNHALFNERLMDRGKFEPALDDFLQILPVIGDAAAASAHSETRAQDDGIAILTSKLKCGIDAVHKLRSRHIEPDLPHRILEQQAILSLLNGIDFCSDEFDAIFLQHTRFGERNGQVQTRLAPHRRQKRIGPLLTNDLFSELDAKGLHIGAVRHVRIGHDRGGIGVDKNDFVPVTAQRLARLRAGVVELAGLADDDRTGADNQNTLEVVSSWHLAALMLFHHLYEVIE